MILPFIAVNWRQVQNRYDGIEMKRLFLTLSFITPLSAWAAADALPTLDHSHSLSSPQRLYRDYSKEFEEEREIRIEKAKREGKEKGIREGEQKKALEVAQRMIVTLPGYADKNIAGITQLSEETVAALRREIEAQKITAQEKKE